MYASRARPRGASLVYFSLSLLKKTIYINASFHPVNALSMSITLRISRLVNGLFS